MDLIKNLDFSKFIPITQRSTDQLFVIAVDENPDLDSAEPDEKFICYPVTENSEIDFATVITLPKKNVDLLPLRIR